MKDYVLSLFLFSFIFHILKEFNLMFSFLILISIWIFFKRDKTVVWLILICIITSVQPTGENTGTTEGRVISVKSNSAIIEKSGVRTLVSPCNQCLLDSMIYVEGNIKSIDQAPTTYGFNFKSWGNQEKFQTSIYPNKVIELEEPTSLQGKIYKKIQSIENEELKFFLLRLLFNIHQKDSEFPFLRQLGFGLSGFLTICKSILALFFYKKTVQKIDLAICFSAMIFYNFSFIPVRLFLGRIMQFTQFSSKDRVGIYGFLCWLFFPEKMKSLAFIIPFGFRVLSVTTNSSKKLASLNFILIIQSYFFHQVSLVTLFFYPLVLKGMGIFYALAWVQLFFYQLTIYKLFNYLLIKISGFFSLYLYGSFVGGGFVFFLLLQLFQKKNKQLHFFCTFLLFLYGNLFHPFTEVSFIQVDQGDSVLIRSLLNQVTILIDTGKPSSYPLLKKALLARGIREIDYVIISHPDLDHNGNLGNLQNDFRIHQVHTTHENINYKSVYLYSLNSEEIDGNDNSLVFIAQVDQLRFLFTGDISSKVESKLVKEGVNLDVDVLKLAHHGSKTSSSLMFLDKTTPQIAIISSGLNNTFNHPSEEVVTRLDKQRIFYLNTKEEGDISFIFTPFLNFFHTSSKKIGIMKKVIQ